MLWEFFINAKTHINEAIVLSMIGEFELAKTVLDTRWFLLYISVYIFTMWDCYTTAVDLNKYSKLADRLDSPILPFKISGLEINYLDYRKPWSGAIWSFLTPGVGSIYCNRLSIGFFVLICFISTVYYSNLLPGVHLTFEGNTKLAATVHSNNCQDVKMAHQEGASKYELSFILAAIFMLLGSIYGFILAWGPIIWAAIGLAVGAILGLVTPYFLKKADWYQKKGQTEVILIVECENQQSEVVEQILWQHKALGLTKTS